MQTAGGMYQSIILSLVKARKDKNIKQFEIANALNVSRQTVTAWEGGVTSPAMTNLLKWCCFLGVELKVVK